MKRRYVLRIERYSDRTRGKSPANGRLEINVKDSANGQLGTWVKDLANGRLGIQVRDSVNDRIETRVEGLATG